MEQILLRLNAVRNGNNFTISRNSLEEFNFGELMFILDNNKVYVMHGGYEFHEFNDKIKLEQFLMSINCL